jgi:hypothetical protein
MRLLHHFLLSHMLLFYILSHKKITQIMIGISTMDHLIIPFQAFDSVCHAHNEPDLELYAFTYGRKINDQLINYTEEGVSLNFLI